MALSVDHIGLSVGNLDRMTEFYYRAFGLETAGVHVFPDGMSRLALLVGPPGVSIELAQIAESTPTSPTTVVDAARSQGWYHWSLRVDDLNTTLARVVHLGGTTVTEPALAQTRHAVAFAYVADPEGNLIELTQAVEDHGGHTGQPLPSRPHPGSTLRRPEVPPTPAENTGGPMPRRAAAGKVPPASLGATTLRRAGANPRRRQSGMTGTDVISAPTRPDPGREPAKASVLITAFGRLRHRRRPLRR
jgi:catechol 2,3-dioxygenase-like lactoylglutathione lyase family enzyme